MSEFHYSIKHQPERLHGNADGLSRCSEAPCHQCKNIEKRDGGPTMQEVCSQPNTHTLEQVQERLVETRGATADRVCTRQTEVDKELIEMQCSLPRPVSTMYKLVQYGGSLTKNELQSADWELKQWHERKDALRIRADGVMVIYLETPGCQQEVIACPSALWQKVIWDTHQMAHAGIAKMTAGSRL